VELKWKKVLVKRRSAAASVAQFVARRSAARKLFPRMWLFLPGRDRNFTCFQYVTLPKSATRARRGRQPRDHFRGLRGWAGRLPPDCFRHLPKNHTQWTTPSAEVMCKHRSNPPRNALMQHREPRTRVRTRMRTAILSSRALRPNIVDASTCPPEGRGPQRSKPEPPRRTEILGTARRISEDLGIQKTTEDRILTSSSARRRLDRGFEPGVEVDLDTRGERRDFFTNSCVSTQEMDAKGPASAAIKTA